jgi:hypothetical protein
LGGQLVKNEDLEKRLRGTDPPKPETIIQHEELKIPLLSYRRSSKAGLWLLIVPAIVAITYILRRDLAISSSFLSGIGSLLGAVDGNPVLSFLIPIAFIGLPCTAMIMNLLSFSHFTLGRERKELLVTIKYRPVNIGIFLFSFAILVFFLLPDRLAF